jgi:cell division protein FtsQ
MKRLIHTILFVLFGVVISTLMGFIVYEHGKQPIHDIKIKISRTDNGGFLNNELMLNTIKEIEGIDSVPIAHFDLTALEKKLISNPFIDHVDAFINIKRDLIVNIKEREALLRIYLPDNNSFYVDCNGDLFPLCSGFTPRLIIANGYINATKPGTHASIYDTIFDKTEIPELYHLSRKIIAYPLLKSQISQIYVNSVGEYDLIPELGSHSIKLGKTDHLDEKLRNLDSFYRKKLVKEGWEKYETINLMYTNQIVCTKK